MKNIPKTILYIDGNIGLKNRSELYDINFLTNVIVIADSLLLFFVIIIIRRDFYQYSNTDTQYNKQGSINFCSYKDNNLKL